MKRRCNSRTRETGISYVELLVAVIIVAISVVPATNALRGGMQAAQSDVGSTVNHFRLAGKLEEVLAVPFTTLAAQAAGITVPTAYSDAPGTIDRRLVYISGYDGDNADSDNNPFTGADAGLLLIRAQIEGSVLTFQSLTTP